MKILISNLAHIGDVILATSMLPALKQAYPQAQIGFLTASATNTIVKNHLHVDFTHIFNHPKLNRGISNFAKRKKEGARSFRQALEEIRERKYDLAFECYTSYSHVNGGVLFYKAGIERRISFSGSSPYYFNERYFWEKSGVHVVEEHKRLLECFGLEEEDLKMARPLLSYKDEVVPPPLPEKYTLIHMGTGDKKKLWDFENWKKLTQKLTGTLVFVGQGEEERKNILRIGRGVNLCGKLSLRQLMHVVEKAELLIGLDSMAGHMAAALNTPALLIYGGAYPLEKWRPYNPCCEVIWASDISSITSETVFEKLSIFKNYANLLE